MKRLAILLLLMLSVYSNAQTQTSTFDSLQLVLQEYKTINPSDPSDRKVLFLLDKLYNESIMSNEGLSIETEREFKQMLLSPDTKNKGILFLLNEYLDPTLLANETDDLRLHSVKLSLMKLLAQECIITYISIPELVMVYMGEVLMSCGMYEAALAHFKRGLKMYRTSLPIQVYLVVLDEEKYKRFKKRLLRDHPNHWMVKSMLE